MERGEYVEIVDDSRFDVHAADSEGPGLVKGREIVTKVMDTQAGSVVVIAEHEWIFKGNTSRNERGATSNSVFAGEMLSSHE